VERFNPKKLNDLEVRKQCRMKTSNRFAALGNLSESEDINWAWKNIKPQLKTV
jgi:hypothetical protein